MYLKFFKNTTLINVLISVLIAGSSYYALIYVASKFGGSLSIDVYFYLLSVIVLFSGLITSLFTVVLMPTIIRLMNTGLTKEAGSFSGAILFISICIIIPISLVSMIYYDLFFLKITKYNSDQIGEAKPILFWFGPILLITVVSDFFRVLVMSMHHYTLAILVGLLPPIYLITFVAFLRDSFGSEVLSLSIFFSRFSTLLLMAFVILYWKNFRLFPLRMDKNLILNYIKTSAPYSLATFVSSFSVFYFDYMATGLSTGVLSSISMAQKIFALPSSILLSPILDIFRVKCAKALAHSDHAYISENQNKLTQLIIYLTIPFSVIFIFYAQEIVSSIFQRGSFDSQSTSIAATCLRIYAYSLPFAAIFSLNGRLVENYQMLIWPSLFGSLGQLACIGLTFVLVNEIGYAGIPASKSLIDIFYFSFLGYFLLYKFGLQLKKQFILKTICVSIVASLVTVFLLYAAKKNQVANISDLDLLNLVTELLIFVMSYLILILVLDRRIFSLRI